MFIGHYAAAPLAAATGKVKLWQACIAVQCVDYIWAVLNLAGIEKTRIIEGFTAANPMDLHFMPYSHSLVYTVMWAALAGVVFLGFHKGRNLGGAVLIAVLVISHWVGDVIVHAPDMTIFPGGEKFGLGLWNTLWVSLPLELGLMMGAVWVYCRVTVPARNASIIPTLLFCGFLIGLQLFNTFGPAPQSITHVAVSAVFAFTLIAFMAGFYERTRRMPAAAP